MITRATKFEGNKYGFFFRVRGYGLTVEKDRTRSFTEKAGYKRIFRLGRWSLEFLKPRF